MHESSSNFYQPNLTRDTSAQASIVSLGEDDDGANAGFTTATKDSPVDLELDDITATVCLSSTTELEDYNIAAANKNSSSNNTTRAAATCVHGDWIA